MHGMGSSSGGPADDNDIPTYWRSLGLPGLIDVHTHFLPAAMQRKVWDYFDDATRNYGIPWPITYRLPEAERLAALRSFGVRAFPSLPYAHKPGMATWLNTEAAALAARVPEMLRSGTFHPEPGVESYVRKAIDDGVVVFKAHVQVGAFDPGDQLLDPVWGLLAEAGVPTVIHCGSGPLPGAHTGPDPIRAVLARHGRLPLIIAHAGMPEYREFADLAASYDRVYLDTTMVGTDFTERLAPMPPDLLPSLRDLGDKVLLGSDFPSIPYPYAHQLAALARLDLGDDWLRAVLHDNAVRLLAL